jgi:4-hydroxy-tetrahydrodipicolinate synthase
MGQVRKGEQFAGLSTALMTPFKNGQVDEAAFKKLIDLQVEAGADGIVPCGTTGESPTLTHEEHDRVIELACQHSAGRLKVIAGTGSNSTAEAIRLTKAAEKAGADGALVVAPYYNKPMMDGMYAHYKAIAESTSLPIVVYNIPGRTGKNIEPDVICKMGEIKNIVAVKESTGSMDQSSQILAGSDLTILSGDDSLTLPLMALGGSGVISVVGNIVPKDVKAMIDAFKAGKLEEAQVWHYRLFNFCRDLLSLSTNPIPVKAAMQLLGRDTGEVRLPLLPLDDKLMASLKKTLTTYGLM